MRPVRALLERWRNSDDRPLFATIGAWGLGRSLNDDGRGVLKRCAEQLADALAAENVQAAELDSATRLACVALGGLVDVDEETALGALWRLAAGRVDVAALDREGLLALRTEVNRRLDTGEHR